jgi:hypothetical protein
MFHEVKNFKELDETKEYAVLIEPRPGYSDNEILDVLKNSGVSKIKILTPGFISAEATGAVLKKLHGKADIHIKKQSVLHS